VSSRQLGPPTDVMFSLQCSRLFFLRHTCLTLRCRTIQCGSPARYFCASSFAIFTFTSCFFSMCYKLLRAVRQLPRSRERGTGWCCLQLDWLLYLNTFMPTPITDDEPIVTLVPDYLRDMAHLISQQDKRSAFPSLQHFRV